MRAEFNIVVMANWYCLDLQSGKLTNLGWKTSDWSAVTRMDTMTGQCTNVHNTQLMCDMSTVLFLLDISLLEQTCQIRHCLLKQKLDLSSSELNVLS